MKTKSLYTFKGIVLYLKGYNAMKLTKTDLDVLSMLTEDVSNEYSMKQIADKLKKPYVKVHGSIKALEAKGIIIKRKMGNSHFCKIEYTSNIDFLCFIESQRARLFLQKNKQIKLLIENFRKKLPIPHYSLILFGSHAEKKNTKSSDIDIAVVCAKQDCKQVERIISNIVRINPLKIHSLVFSYMDLIKMLRSKELTVGKEMLKKHILFHGSEQFYECLRLSE